MENTQCDVAFAQHIQSTAYLHNGGTMEIDKKDNELDKKDVEDKEKKVQYRGVRAMPYVIGNEAFEKLGTMGTANNLLVYLTTVFNMSNIAATNLLNTFNGSANFGTLLGAFLSDTYFGRYKTLGFACVSSFLGMVVLTLTAIIPQLHPPHCVAKEIANCKGPNGGQLAFLIGGLGLLVIGAGGIRPCNLAFGADQFDPDTESGKRGISSFFNWYYFTITFAMLVSVTFVVYIQASVSWGIGLAIPALCMFVSCALFFLGTKLYVIVQPQGSPLVSVVQTIVVSFKKRKLKLPQELSETSMFGYVPHHSVSSSKLAHTDQFRFLDKAAIITEEDRITPEGLAQDPWKLCSVQQVEELKCLLRVLPIWLSGIVYNVAVVTMNNYVVFQALQSNRQLGKLTIPAASYSIFTSLTITIWVPFYDRIVVPKLRKLTGNIDGITLLQKMGIGMFLIIVTLVVNASVEHSRRVLALTGPTIGIEPQRGAISSLSGLWLIAPLTLAGLSEAFSMIALVEFYYNQFPEDMRSIGGACLFCGLAMSSYLSSFLQSLVVRFTTGGHNQRVGWLPEDINKGRLDLFYFLIAGIEFINFLCFLVCAKWYRYRGRRDNDGQSQEKKPQIGLA